MCFSEPLMNLKIRIRQGTVHVANPPHGLQKVPRHRSPHERLSCNLRITYGMVWDGNLSGLLTFGFP